MLKPIYTPENCLKVAYQLNWSYSLFWRVTPVPDTHWLDELKGLNEPDGIRVLRHELTGPLVSQFFVSTSPSVVPRVLVQRIKGRLQAIIRPTAKDAFQRNFALRSVGSADRATVEDYIAGQLNHHRLADPNTEMLFQNYQFHDPKVDLSRSSRTSHAIYWFNLHIVLFNNGGHRTANEKRMRDLRSMCRRNAAKKGHWLSRFGQLPDHLHFSLRANLNESPADVALSYMNNFAYVLGMRPEFRYSYYAGTIGEYTLRAIPKKG